MNTYFIGSPIVAPDYMWSDLWNSMKKNMIKLNQFGLIDDDQTVLLMTYKENKELFEIHKCNWFDVIENYSNQKFSIRIKEYKFKCLRKICHRLKWKKNLIKYSFKWYRILKNEDTKG